MYFSCADLCSVSGGAGVVTLAPHCPSLAAAGKASGGGGGKQEGGEGGAGPAGAGRRHRALFAVGGPVEDGPGRLPYIDGCTDTLLVAPVRMGAPCLNHLHFPGGVRQTGHTHPSGRSGLVLSGSGTCVIDAGTEGGGGPAGSRIPLTPGTAFVIPAGAPHAFETAEGGSLDVVAFHPDSDFGPTATDHPMVNRTIVNGVPASQIAAIQTTDDE